MSVIGAVALTWLIGSACFVFVGAVVSSLVDEFRNPVFRGFERLAWCYMGILLITVASGITFFAMKAIWEGVG